MCISEDLRSIRRGEFFRKARVNAGLSIREAALLADVSSSTICRFESGDMKDYKYETVLKICRAYHVSIDQVD